MVTVTAKQLLVHIMIPHDGGDVKITVIKEGAVGLQNKRSCSDLFYWIGELTGNTRRSPGGRQEGTRTVRRMQRECGNSTNRESSPPHSRRLAA